MTDDATLIRLGLALAESLDEHQAASAAGIVRQLARRVLDLTAVAWPTADGTPCCTVCGRSLPPGSRSDKKTCSPRCRQRLRRDVSVTRPDDGMKKGGVMAAKTKTQDPDVGQWVLVDEIAARLGHFVEHVLGGLNGEVWRDWCGRFVVPASVARELVERHAREEAEREARKAEAAERLREWQERYAAEYAKAAAEIAAYEADRFAASASQAYMNADEMRNRFRQMPPPAVQHAIAERIREHMAAWEEKHPAPPRPEEV